ncbi:unnamed protein product [Gadus morhua 'NCC']
MAERRDKETQRQDMRWQPVQSQMGSLREESKDQQKVLSLCLRRRKNQQPLVGTASFQRRQIQRREHQVFYDGALPKTNTARAARYIPTLRPHSVTTTSLMFGMQENYRIVVGQ